MKTIYITDILEKNGVINTTFLEELIKRIKDTSNDKKVSRSFPLLDLNSDASFIFSFLENLSRRIEICYEIGFLPKERTVDDNFSFEYIENSTSKYNDTLVISKKSLVDINNAIEKLLKSKESDSKILINKSFFDFIEPLETISTFRSYTSLNQSQVTFITAITSVDLDMRKTYNLSLK